MSIEATKAAVRRYLEDVPDVLDELADPDLTIIAPGIPPNHGLEDVKKFSAAYFGALSERRLTVEEMIGEGDKVAARWTIRLTTRVPLPLPNGTVISAGKTVTFTGISMLALRGGKIFEERTQMDWLEFLAAARPASATMTDIPETVTPSPGSD